MAGGQILWFEKNKIDLEKVDTQIIITDTTATNNGQDFVDFMRNRNNFSGWMTTDSNDAALTQVDTSLGDVKAITDILLIKHNLKDYTIQFKAGAGAYGDFSPPINPTTNTQSSNLHAFEEAQATDIRIIINGAQIADADKFISQLIITERIGKFQGFPKIKRPKIDTSKRVTKMLSGKRRIVESLEAFSCSLDVSNWRIQNDIDIIEEIYFKREGVLLWINSDNPSQFFLNLKGYRREDIFLVRPKDSYQPELAVGLYQSGIRQSIDLVEVIT